MNNKKENNQQRVKKPGYLKPAIVATYTEEELSKEFASVYGATFVDTFVDLF